MYVWTKILDQFICIIHLIARYVGVDESEDVQLFSYFVKSEKDPANDPLILWLTGGPGCTSFSGLIYEIGAYIPWHPAFTHTHRASNLVSWLHFIFTCDLPKVLAFKASTMYNAGPLNIEKVAYNGTLPTLVLNHNSWTKVCWFFMLFCFWRIKFYRFSKTETFTNMEIQKIWMRSLEDI